MNLSQPVGLHLSTVHRQVYQLSTWLITSRFVVTKDTRTKLHTDIVSAHSRFAPTVFALHSKCTWQVRTYCVCTP